MMFRTSIIVFSAAATVLSLIFMLSPSLYQQIEEFLGFELGGGSSFNTILEGKINFINDWIFKNRAFFGPLFAVLAAWNTRNAILYF